jgi:hypothetical protein
MFSTCPKTQHSRARKGSPFPVISCGSAIAYFKSVATDWWWERDQSGKLGFFACTRQFPDGVYVTGATGFAARNQETHRVRQGETA